MKLMTAIGLLLGTALLSTPSPALADAPKPGTLAYQLRDLQNMRDAYGRITGPGGQLTNPNYLPALGTVVPQKWVTKLLAQAATPTRLAITTAMVIPAQDVGNPLRAGWDEARGQRIPVAFTNRYGALLRGNIWAPGEDARDPYTGDRLRPPYPGVVITDGSVQGSQGLYEWLAQDLAERGYVVMTYDVQGQGTSETLPHTSGSALPICNPLAPPEDLELIGCPGVPAQQLSNFVYGTRDALDFFTSTPSAQYANPGSEGAEVNTYNPLHALWDRSKDPHPATPGRTTRIAVVGHSLGAAGVSYVQAVDERVAAVVALDKLVGPSGSIPLADSSGNVPSVPALALQSEYGFAVTPWITSGTSSITPTPSPDGPDRLREKQTGYNDWLAAGQDVMLVVPRASTHIEYTDVPLILPASRYGQALSSVYSQLWLDRYLKHVDNTATLTGDTFHYLEPTGKGAWSPIQLKRDGLLSFYYCSAYRITGRDGVHHNGDIAGLGDCGE